MHTRLTLALSTLAVLAGCTSTPPIGPDVEGPRIRLTLMTGPARPFYDTAIAPAPDDNRCFKPRGFPETPARLAVNLTDSGGLDHIVLSILAGTIVEGSLVAAPDWSVSAAMDRDTQRTTVTFVPPEGDRVLTGALVVFNVASANGAGIALDVLAQDTSGNRNTLPQVDLRTATDPVPCSG
jgi:hypothetical protein